MWKYIDPYRSATISTLRRKAVEAMPTEPTKPDATITDPDATLQ
jgi:hypothetical protein